MGDVFLICFMQLQNILIDFIIVKTSMWLVVEVCVVLCSGYWWETSNYYTAPDLIISVEHHDHSDRHSLRSGTSQENSGTGICIFIGSTRVQTKVDSQ